MSEKPDDGNPPSEGSAEAGQEEEERIPLTPGLVILGILAVALGVFAGLVMSAQALSR